MIHAFLRGLFINEMILGIAIKTFGERWAHNARLRLGRLCRERSENSPRD